jgi:hypothetical protein
MLIAEIHGKVIPEAQGDEDQLTSAVFGHLRYVPPGRFWTRLFSRAMSPPVGGQCLSVQQVAAESGRNLDSFDSLEIHFWPSHPDLGEPDMAMCFTGRRQKPLVVLVEAKLFSPIGGCGQGNQLVRYLRITDDLTRLQPPLPGDALVLVVYLTRKEAITEVQDSLAIYGNTPANRRRLFRLQWQDVCQVIEETLQEPEQPLARRVLTDVDEFLRRRGLNYFNGFWPVEGLKDVQSVDGSFYRPDAIFSGFRLVDGLAEVRVVRGGWCHGN